MVPIVIGIQITIIATKLEMKFALRNNLFIEDFVLLDIFPENSIITSPTMTFNND